MNESRTCCFCGIKNASIEGLNIHSAECPDHPAVKEALALRLLVGKMQKIVRRDGQHTRICQYEYGVLDSCTCGLSAALTPSTVDADMGKVVEALEFYSNPEHTSNSDIAVEALNYLRGGTK